MKEIKSQAKRVNEKRRIQIKGGIVGAWIVLFAIFLIAMCTAVSQLAVAQQVSLSGWFTIIWGDSEPGSEEGSKTVYMLTDDNGKSTQLLLEEELALPFGGMLVLNRKRVTVEGVTVEGMRAARGSGMAAAALQVQSIQLGLEESALATPEAEGVVSGSQPWMSIMCKFADVSAEPKPLSYFQDMYRSTYPGLDHYWREVSYDAISIIGSGAVGWYTLPQPKSYYVYGNPPSADLGRLQNDCIAVADPDVYFPSYVGINLMFNGDLGCCAWGGSWFKTLDGVSKRYSMTWEPPAGYANQSIMAHEMGHGFGLPHSSGQYGYVYDNQWDVMSNDRINCYLSSDPVYGCLGQHTISYHKDILGWIPAWQKYMAAPGSQATITLEQLALPQTSDYKMAQIPIGGSTTHFYTVEVRRKVGYDVKLPGQAVIIHDVDTTWGIPAHVLDVDNNGNTGDNGAMWTVGETFTDSANGIAVSVNSASATAFNVTIATFTCTDNDGDGYPQDGGNCGAVDCNDSNPSINPGVAEACDSIDNNCNGQIDEGCILCNGATSTIVGTPGDDVINGTAGGDVINGLAGNDTINALGGNDTICGGSGNDTINGGVGVDALRGDQGNDILKGGADNDTLEGGAGTDSCDGGTGTDTFAAGCETVIDIPTCAGLDATIVGTAGNDSISGTQGNDVVQAFGGDDTVSGLGGNDTICGNDGNDTINGGYGPDTLKGDKGNDKLNGGPGNDSLAGGAGTDSCNGDIGTDTAPDGCETLINIP